MITLAVHDLPNLTGSEVQMQVSAEEFVSTSEEELIVQYFSPAIAAIKERLKAKAVVLAKLKKDTLDNVSLYSRVAAQKAAEKETREVSGVQ